MIWKWNYLQGKWGAPGRNCSSHDAPKLVSKNQLQAKLRKFSSPHVFLFVNT
jgi:hypothetical protein